jgi:hypothetical protein
MDVAALTELLRHSPLELWVQLREVLVDKGLELERTALAWSSEEGPELEFGVIATTDRRVFQYLLTANDLTEWRDLSGSWKKTPYADAVRAALVLLKKPGRSVG